MGSKEQSLIKMQIDAMMEGIPKAFNPTTIRTSHKIKKALGCGEYKGLKVEANINYPQHRIDIVNDAK